MIDSATLAASFFPAVLLAIAATLLTRAREIDLSLDQQCFFIAALQVCSLKSVPPWLALLLSWLLLATLQSGKLYFNRATNSNSMVTSVAAALMYLGAGFLVIWYYQPEDQSPQYIRWTSPILFGLTCIFLIMALLVADTVVSSMHKAKFPTSPFGATPDTWLSTIWSVWPSAAVTCAAGTMLGLHAGSITPAFSHGFGILAATAAIVSYGRLVYAIGIGLALGALYIGGILVVTSVRGEIIQSFLVQIGTFVIVGVWALLVSRRRI